MGSLNLIKFSTKDPLNDAHLLNSDDFPHASFVRRYNSQSFKDAHELSNREAIKAAKKHKNVSILEFHT